MANPRAGFLALVIASAVCAAPAAAAFTAAAGKIDITPDLKTETTYLAGFGASGRPAKGVHDPLYARAVVVSDGRKTAAIVAVDCIGLFRQDVLAMRRAVGWNDADHYVFVSATHDHSGPDTLGLWGRFPGVSGVNARYRKRVIAAVAKLVLDLSHRMRPAQLSYARRDLDARGLCRDSRDPVVIDPELDAVQFLARSGGAPIGTIVRWSCHPETSWRDNDELTADYPGQLCARVESRTGGACLFQSGVIGGLLTPDSDHDHGPLKGYAEGRRIGQAVADAALSALRGAARVREPKVGFESALVRLPIENSRYILFMRSLVFGHKLQEPDGSPLAAWKTFWLPLRHLIFFPLPASQRPWVETEVSRLDVGPVRFLGIPGELFPELAIGGYDGRYRFGHPLVDANNPNPPRLAEAPKGPYLRQQVKAKLGILVGLANDELGYIVPPYDFQADADRSMTPQPPGDHYEETNSLGPSAAPILLKALSRLARQ